MSKFTERNVFDMLNANPQKFGVLSLCNTSSGSISYIFKEGYEIPLTWLTQKVNHLTYGDRESEQGEVTVTTNEAGECVLVSRQDEDHKILKVIWEKK